MKPVKFPEYNAILAKDQPPYLPLPAFVNKEETISLWKMTWLERIRVLFSGKVWVRQLNFGQPLQPQKLCILDIEKPTFIYRVVSTEDKLKIQTEK